MNQPTRVVECEEPVVRKFVAGELTEEEAFAEPRRLQFKHLRTAYEKVFGKDSRALIVTAIEDQMTALGKVSTSEKEWARIRIAEYKEILINLGEID